MNDHCNTLHSQFLDGIMMVMSLSEPPLLCPLSVDKKGRISIAF